MNSNAKNNANAKTNALIQFLSKTNGLSFSCGSIEDKTLDLTDKQGLYGFSVYENGEENSVLLTLRLGGVIEIKTQGAKGKEVLGDYGRLIERIDLYKDGFKTYTVSIRETIDGKEVYVKDAPIFWSFGEVEEIINTY